VELFTISSPVLSTLSLAVDPRLDLRDVTTNADRGPLGGRGFPGRFSKEAEKIGKGRKDEQDTCVGSGYGEFASLIQTCDFLLDSGLIASRSR
jgi:hypothetical protein